MTKKELAKFKRRERDDNFGDPNKPFVECELLWYLKFREKEHHNYLYTDRKFYKT